MSDDALDDDSSRRGFIDALVTASLPRRIAWATAARLVILTVMLVFIGALNFQEDRPAGSFTTRMSLTTLAAAFALSGAYATLLRVGRHLGLVVRFQLIADQAIWTSVVFLSGGATSGATSFYGVSVLMGALLAGMRGAAIASAAGCAFFFALLAGLGTGFVPPPPDQLSSLYAASAAELAYAGAVNGLVMVVVALLAGTLTDRLAITGGKLVEATIRAEKAERLAALGRLATGLAHEIRNPLGSISGSIQLLRAGAAISEEDQQLCDIIQREASRLNDLVNDMMDLSRRRRPQPIVVDLVKIAGDVVALAATSGRGVSDVAVELVGMSEARIYADRDQMQQLIWNLVRNAVQASSAGDVVTVTLSEDEEGIVSLEVADRGEGLGATPHDRIFDAFFTTRSHGTGVGLAVVKQIVDDHGFTVDVESGQEGGAVFRVRMTRRTEDELGKTGEFRAPDLDPQFVVSHG